MSAPDPILGLDLGTSTCLACVVHQGKPVFIQPDRAYPQSNPDMPTFAGDLMPSAFYHREGETLVGHRALEELTDAAHAGNVVREVKRLMHQDGKYPIRLGGRTFSPSQITGEYVKVLVRAAALQLGMPPTTFQRAVVTVPADFSPHAQAATEKACVEYGGLRQVQLVDEPIAAAYSLGLHEQPGRRRVLVIDLGGGTFDVALWEVGRDVGAHGFEELGRDGNNQLGGLDWDREIADWILREVRPRFPDDVFQRLMSDPRDPGHTYLFEASEAAKFVLARQLKNFGMADPSRPLDPRRFLPMHVSFKRTTATGDECSADMPSEVFFRRTERLLNQCIWICHRLFHDVGTVLKRPFGWQDLDCVYLAGGGSRMPTVPRRFAECWGKAPVLDDNPQHAVAKGAALLAELWRQGHSLPGIVGKVRYMRSIGLLVTPSEPDQALKYHPIIPRNQELPFQEQKTFPVLGDRQRQRLLLRFAEERFHHDGQVREHEQVAELRMDNLPPPLQPGAEFAQVTVTCAPNQAPSFRVEFRGRRIETNLNDLFPRRPDEPERNGPGPNGTGAAASRPPVGARHDSR